MQDRALEDPYGTMGPTGTKACLRVVQAKWDPMGPHRAPWGPMGHKGPKGPYGPMGPLEPLGPFSGRGLNYMKVVLAGGTGPLQDRP